MDRRRGDDGGADRHAMMWFVRLENGAKYGPADEDKLLAWAREGRIAPDSQISTDGKHWVPAPQKPELGMEWLVEAEPGQYYGPFHRDVVRALMETKRIAPDTRTFRLFGENESTSQDELEKAQAELKRTQAELREAQTKTDAAMKEAAECASGISKLTVMLKRSNERGAKLNAALGQSRTETATERSRAGELARKAEADAKALADACKRESALAKELRARTESLQAEKVRVRELTSELAAVRDDAEKARDELEKARDELEKERKACEKLKAAAEKSGKKSGFRGLFKGKTREDLSLLELAAQRELARRVQGRDTPGPGHPGLDVIDV